MSRLRDGKFDVPIQARAKYFSLFQNVHIGFEVHRAFYSMGDGFFPGGTEAGA
jgi:hypothetical protein